uniref:NR LBD domain-containing protein n=1 Tax=Heliothis virescens TaxID=7102 RepID=A0A2A4J9A1_HELVI
MATHDSNRLANLAIDKLHLNYICSAPARLLAAAARWLRAVPAAHALPYVYHCIATSALRLHACWPPPRAGSAPCPLRTRCRIYICSAPARLLAAAARWLRAVPAAHALPYVYHCIATSALRLHACWPPPRAGSAPCPLRTRCRIYICSAPARLLAAAARWLRAVPAAHALPYVYHCIATSALRLHACWPPPRAGSAPCPLRTRCRIYICSAPARLLAAAARWLRAVPAAHALPYVYHCIATSALRLHACWPPPRAGSAPCPLRTRCRIFEIQVTLLKKCWPELFVLSLSMFAQQLSLSSLLPQMVSHLQAVLRDRASNDCVDRSHDMAMPEITASDYSDERIAEVSSSLTRLQQFISNMEQLRVQQREHAHLRALCLFSPDGVPDFLTRKLQDYQIKVLRSLRATCQPDEDRLATLLLQLPVLRTFSGPFLEDVFFVGFVGDVSIDDVIPYLLNAER